MQDLVRALVLVAENGSVRNKTYFVAAPEFYSWREILDQLLREMDLKFVLKIPYPLMLGVAFASEAVSRLAGKAPMVTRGDLRSARDNYWLCDAGLIREELGFQTEVEFGQGIRDIVRQFKAGPSPRG